MCFLKFMNSSLLALFTFQMRVSIQNVIEQLKMQSLNHQ